MGKRVRAASGALLALASAMSPAAAQTGGQRSPNVGEAVRLILDRTNSFRGGAGVEPIAPDARLSAAARGFAAYLARTGRFGHEADGRTPAQRARAEGYAYCLILENIASVYSSEGFEARELADRVMRGWKESPGHRRNLLDPGATEVGVAIARSDASGAYYAVQLFGRPQSLRIDFRIGNASPAAVEYEVDGRSYSLPPRATRMHQDCGAPRLLVHLPGERQATVVEPANGDRWDVERLGPRYRLKKS